MHLRLYYQRITRASWDQGWPMNQCNMQDIVQSIPQSVYTDKGVTGAAFPFLSAFAKLRKETNC